MHVHVYTQTDIITCMYMYSKCTCKIRSVYSIIPGECLCMYVYIATSDIISIYVLVPHIERKVQIESTILLMYATQIWWTVVTLKDTEWWK